MVRCGMLHAVHVVRAACRYEAVEDVLQVTDLYDPRTQWASYVINACKASMPRAICFFHRPHRRCVGSMYV